MDYNNYNKQINIINNMNPINSNNIRINRQNRPMMQKQRNEDNNFLKISGEVYHFLIKGELVFDLKSEELIWTIKGEKTPEYKKKYGDQEKIIIQKSNIKRVIKHQATDSRYLLRIELKNIKEKPYNFSFQDNEKLRNKFHDLLSNNTYKFYKNEFQMLSIEQQKEICLLLSNRYLLQLYRKLILINGDINTAWNFIKFRYPEAITINLGKNRIQLSRDEELIMLSQRKYNITKLLYSDSNIYKSYINEGNSYNENFWKDFLDSQRGYNTYIVGGYKPSVCNIGKKDKIEKNEEDDLFEDLERDKYYYDCYETNYLYYNDNMKNEQNRIKDIIKLLNDYSINKIKDINYFSYTSFCMNEYNSNKRVSKNKFYKRNININFKNTKDEIDFHLNSKNCKKRLKKDELLNKLKSMEIEYDKKKEDNSSYSTMKIINDENLNYYNSAKFEPSLISVENIIKSFLVNYIFLIKDLALDKKYFIEKTKKQEEKLSPQKKSHNELLIKQRIERYNKEIRNLYENFKKKVNSKKGSFQNESVIDFFKKNVEKILYEASLNK